MRRLQRTRLVADHHPSMGSLTGVSDHGAGISRHLPGAPQPRPPGSPSLRPPATTATANYQAAVAAAVSSQQPPPQMATGVGRPPAGTVVRPPPPSAMVLPSAAIAQQQRQALLNRSHQIGSYISTMQASAAAAGKVPPGSPLLRPPSIGSLTGSPAKVTTHPSTKVDPGVSTTHGASSTAATSPVTGTTAATSASPQTRRRSAAPVQQQQNNALQK